MAKTAGRGVAANDFVAVRVHGEGAAEMVEGFEQILIKIAAFGKDGYVARRGMALGKYEPVPILPLGILWVDVEILEVEQGKYLYNAQRTAHMGAAGPRHNIDYGKAQLLGDLFKTLFFFRLKCHYGNSSFIFGFVVLY